MTTITYSDTSCGCTKTTCVPIVETVCHPFHVCSKEKLTFDNRPHIINQAPREDAVVPRLAPTRSIPLAPLRLVRAAVQPLLAAMAAVVRAPPVLAVELRRPRKVETVAHLRLTRPSSLANPLTSRSLSTRRRARPAVLSELVLALASPSPREPQVHLLPPASAPVPLSLLALASPFSLQVA